MRNPKRESQMSKSATAEFVGNTTPIRLFRRVNLGSSYLAKVILFLLSAFLFLGALAIVYTRSDWAAIAASVAQLSWPSISVAFALMLAGGMLASLRLKLIADDLGYQLSFPDAFCALGLGQLAGIVFFQIAGQLMARGLLFSRHRIPVSGTIIVTGYERLVALAISLLVAIAGATYLFGKISIDTAEGGILVVKIFIGLLVVGTCGAIFSWGRLAAEHFPRLNARSLMRLGRSIGLSLGIQLTTLGAYLVLLNAVAPGIPVLSLAAASALVMLAASLPISFSGWGMRELSAIIALGAVGVSAQASFTVAAVVGLVSLSVVGVMTAMAIHHYHHYQPALTHAREQSLKLDFGALLDYALPLFAAMAVFFQVFVPVNRGQINVNLADPVVILGGCLFVVYNLDKGWPRWRVPNFEIYIGLATLLIVTAFLHGLDRFGWTNWAFTNRLLGWFVLLAYGATGALVVRRAGRQGLDLLLRTFVIAAASIVGLEVVFLVLHTFGVQIVKALVQVPFSGFSVNRNAYAFQLLLVVSVILATRWRNPVFLLGIVFLGIWFAGSRAGLIALPIIFAMAFYMRALPLRTTAVALALAAAALVFIAAIPELVGYFAATRRIPFHISSLMVNSVSSDAEHVKSLIGGWAMFLAHPVFGAGLGAFMKQEMQTGTPLVIHSTPLWLLAEMGVVGLLIMVAPVVRIFSSEVRHPQQSDVAGRLLVLIITAFAAVSNVHEIMYQRAFWLLLGAALAYAPAALSIKAQS
jgi:hypothetical protein